MQNVKTSVSTKNGKRTLTIEVDLSQELGLSNKGQGPNMMVATSRGIVDLADAGVRMGLNIFKTP